MNCCHRHDCADIHCPGRVTHDSDGLTVTEHYYSPAVLSPVAVWALAAMACVLVGILITFGG